MKRAQLKQPSIIWSRHVPSSHIFSRLAHDIYRYLHSRRRLGHFELFQASYTSVLNSTSTWGSSLLDPLLSAYFHSHLLNFQTALPNDRSLLGCTLERRADPH